jgi:creatinine amidohydrolase
MLAIDPDRVRLDAAQVGVTEPLPQLLGALQTGGVRAVTANGVLGDPSMASAEEGRALLDALAGDLIAEVERVLG